MTDGDGAGGRTVRVDIGATMFPRIVRETDGGRAGGALAGALAVSHGLHAGRGQDTVVKASGLPPCDAGVGSATIAGALT